jgi:hypothetical protein
MPAATFSLKVEAKLWRLKCEEIPDLGILEC